MQAKTTQDDIKLAKYRWEFLRLNINYKEDYKKLLIGKIPRGERFFEIKWLVEEPLDPALSYEQQKEKFGELYKDASDAQHQFYSVDEYLHFIIIKAFHAWSIIPPVDDTRNYREDSNIPVINEEGLLNLTINLNYKDSDIRKKFRKVISNWKKLYPKKTTNSLLLDNISGISQEGLVDVTISLKYNKRLLNEELKNQLSIWRIQYPVKNELMLEKIKSFQLIPIERDRTNLYERYLWVWGMRTQWPPPKFQTIGDQLIKNSYIKDQTIERTTETARKSFYRAFELIYGEEYDPKKWKEIRKGRTLTLCKDCPDRSTCKEGCVKLLEQLKLIAGGYQRDEPWGDISMLQARQEKKKRGYAKRYNSKE